MAVGQSMVGRDEMDETPGMPVPHLNGVGARHGGASPLTLVDLAVPRDVAPSVAGMQDVQLLDVRDVSRFAGERFAPPAKAIAAAENSVEDAVDSYLAATSGRKVAPLVTALRAKVEQTRVAELDRAKALMASQGIPVRQ